MSSCRGSTLHNAGRLNPRYQVSPRSEGVCKLVPWHKHQAFQCRLGQQASQLSLWASEGFREYLKSPRPYSPQASFSSAT